MGFRDEQSDRELFEDILRRLAQLESENRELGERVTALENP